LGDVFPITTVIRRNWDILKDLLQRGELVELLYALIAVDLNKSIMVRLLGELVDQSTGVDGRHVFRVERLDFRPSSRTAIDAPELGKAIPSMR
jgi:hypothetical protein